MAVLKIICSPDPLLKQKSKPVKEVTDSIRAFIDDMVETMHDRNGIGLAAVQVGVLQRILVMDLGRGSERYPDMETQGEELLHMVNPEIIAHSEEKNSYEEGCLSFPGQYAEVTRPKKVTIKYLDYHGKEKTLECDDLLATCVQHEIDHLNGVTFVDHISRTKRNMILKKMKKHQKFMEDESIPDKAS